MFRYGVKITLENYDVIKKFHRLYSTAVSNYTNGTYLYFVTYNKSFHFTKNINNAGTIVDLGKLREIVNNHI